MVTVGISYSGTRGDATWALREASVMIITNYKLPALIYISLVIIRPEFSSGRRMRTVPEPQPEIGIRWGVSQMIFDGKLLWMSSGVESKSVITPSFRVCTSDDFLGTYTLL